jgi:hypothetical protein
MCRSHAATAFSTHRLLTAVRQLESLVALHQGRAELALRLQNALVDVEELTSDM